MAKKFTARINAKGLDATGVTEDHARKMSSTQGKTTLLIVEAHHGVKTVDEDGNTQVSLTLNTVEPVPSELEERVREFQRALYRQRPEVAGQAALSGVDDGPTPDAALAGMDAVIERDPDTGAPTGVWDGNTDAPEPAPTVKAKGKKAAAPKALAAVPEPVSGPWCAYPGCGLEDGHEGDHDSSEDVSDG